MGDIEVKDSDLEILCLSFWLDILCLHLLNRWMGQVDTLNVNTIMTNLSDLEFNVTDFYVKASALSF